MYIIIYLFTKYHLTRVDQLQGYKQLSEVKGGVLTDSGNYFSTVNVS